MKKTKDLLKKQEEIKEKVFTNKKSNNIIKTIYNPLKVNCKIYKRGSGLFMKDERIKLRKRKFIKLLSKICLDLNIENYEKEIEKFLSNNKRG